MQLKLYKPDNQIHVNEIVHYMESYMKKLQMRLNTGEQSASPLVTIYKSKRKKRESNYRVESALKPAH